MEVLQPFLFRIILICTDASIMEVSKVLSLCQEASFLPKWLSFCVCKKTSSYSLSFYILLPSCFDVQHDSSQVFSYLLLQRMILHFLLLFFVDFLLKMSNKVKSVDGVQVKNISEKAKNTGHWSEFSLHKNFKLVLEQNVT